MEPLGSNMGGFVAVGVCATLSVLATGGFMLYSLVSLVIHFFRGGFREANKDRIPAPHSVRLFQSQFGFLFVNLVLADFIQAIGFAMDWQWIRSGGMDPSSVVCSFQGAMIEMGDVGSALWSFVIALHTVLLLALRWRPHPFFPFVAMVVVWGTVSMLGFIGPVALKNGNNDPFYGLAGGWCWISKEYELQRFIMQYTFIFFALFASVILYGATWWIVRHRRGQEVKMTPERERLETAAKRMLGYPIIYMILVLPLSTFRFAGAAGHHWPIPILLASGGIYTLSGLANIVLFSVTRNVLPVARFIPAASRFSMLRPGHAPSGSADSKLSVVDLIEKGQAGGFVTVDLNGAPSFIAIVAEEEESRRNRALPARIWQSVFGSSQAAQEEEEVIDIRQGNLAHAILLRGNSLRVNKDLPDVPNGSKV